MSQIEESIELDVPVSTAYNQWTQFEEFPKFMEGVEEVRQMGDQRLHWKAEVAGQSREWDARITEQEPDSRIAWTSEDGTENAGVVTFHKISSDKSKVMLQLDVNPQGFMENIADGMGFIKRRAAGDLVRFKEFIEQRGTETGAWRGEIK